jgi:hypothetical protein
MSGSTVSGADWSGEFWTDGGTGYMSVSYDDERLHKPPAGWDLIEVLQDEEAETYVYRQRGDGTLPAVPIAQPDQQPADLRLAVQADKA